jgi:hypothetical protein
MKGCVAVPFKSKAQQRFFFSAESKGKLPKGTAKEWAHATPSIKALPEKVEKNSKEIEAEAREDAQKLFGV